MSSILSNPIYPGYAENTLINKPTSIIHYSKTTLPDDAHFAMIEQKPIQFVPLRTAKTDFRLWDRAQASLKGAEGTLKDYKMADFALSSIFSLATLPCTYLRASYTGMNAFLALRGARGLLGMCEGLLHPDAVLKSSATFLKETVKLRL